MSLARSIGLAIGITFLLGLCDFINLHKKVTQLLSFINTGFITMLVFMVTKDDYDRYGIWKTFIGTKQPSITEMLEFGKWAVFKPIGLLMQATIIDFNTDDDALESNETMEIASQYASTSASLINSVSKSTASSTGISAPKPPPPPPPIPPPLPIKTPPLSNDVDFKCKKVSWKELKINMKNTIWDSVNRKLENGEAVVDRQEIMELFREKPRKSRKFSGLSTNSVSSEDVFTLTGKKKLNISIALAHHQLFADDLIKAVKNVDVRLLEADFLSTIENFLPDQTEESSLMQKYSSRDLQIERQVLTDPEEFSFLLASIPQFRKRIRAMVFQCSFFDRVNAICKNFEVMKASIEEIRKSKKLEKILMYILSTGKTINNTPTKAFNIDFLPTASCCKTSDGNSNFLAYVISKIKSDDPQVLKISEELPSLGKAVKVSLIEVDRDCTELAVEYSSIAMELDSIATESEGLKDFLQQGKLDLNNIKRKRRQIQQELNDLAEYFGIDPLKTKPTELFGIFKQFLTDLSNTVDVLVKKLQNQKARSMNRSISAPSFRRSSRNSSFRGSRNSSTRSSRNSSFRKSSRRSSITSNISDATYASGDSSLTDGVVNDYNVSFDIGAEESKTPKSNSTGVLATQDDDYKDKAMNVVKNALQTSSPQIKRNLNNVLKKMTSEDEDFTSKTDILRKVLLSPVKEKPEKHKVNQENLMKIRLTEDIKGTEISDGKVDNNKERVGYSQEHKISNSTKENGIPNGTVFANGYITSNENITNLSREVKLNGQIKQTEKTQNRNEKKQKENPVPLMRSSSLRRSNRKPKRVSVKSMQAKEIQKTKRLLISKSESNLINLSANGPKSKTDSIQSVVLKPGFIEKLSPMKCGIRDIKNNNNANNNDSKTTTLDDYYNSETLKKNSKEETLLRRTKSAIISRNKQKASLVIFV